MEAREIGVVQVAQRDAGPSRAPSSSTSAATSPLAPPQLGQAAASAAVDLQTAAWALGYTAIRRHDASTPSLRGGTARGRRPNFQ